VRENEVTDTTVLSRGQFKNLRITRIFTFDPFKSPCMVGTEHR
jgi:hypothetical protein